MAIATSGYMTVIIDFSGLVATRRHADPGNGHKDAASLTLARVPDQLAPEFGGADANASPGFQHRKHDRCKSVLIGKKAPDVLPEGASLSSRNEQTEGFHERKTS